MASSATQLRHREILASLQSKEPKIVNKALTDIKKIGTAELLPSLLEVYTTTANKSVKLGLENILNQLKDSKAVGFLMEALSNEQYKDYHQKFAAAIWESGLDASAHVSTLIEIALKTDYLTCLEILTIIENIEEGITEQDVEQGIAAISEQLQWKKSDNDPLLASIIQVLQGGLID